MIDFNCEINKIREFLLNYSKETHTDGYVLGISGGLDSSVMFKILEPLPLKFIAMKMPIHSLKSDEVDADLLTKDSDREILRIDLSDIYDEFIKVLPDTSSALANTNLKPRLRMTTLYQVAQTNNLLVCGATNKSEYLTGYFTKHGDSGVDVMPLREYIKSEIYKMGELLEVPDAILKKPPSAGLFEGQTDEDEMGISYAELDGYLSGEKIDEKQKQKIESMIKKTEHKRCVPIFYKREEE